MILCFFFMFNIWFLVIFVIVYKFKYIVYYVIFVCLFKVLSIFFNLLNIFVWSWEKFIGVLKFF